MNSSKKDNINEPSEIYVVAAKANFADDNQDLWDSLPEDVKKNINLGLEQSKQNLGVSHEEVMSKLKVKYPFLNGL